MPIKKSARGAKGRGSSSRGGAKASSPWNKNSSPSPGRITRSRDGQAVSEASPDPDPEVLPVSEVDPITEQEYVPETDSNADPDLGLPDYTTPIIGANPTAWPFNMKRAIVDNDAPPTESAVPKPKPVQGYREDEEGNIFFSDDGTGLTTTSTSAPVESGDGIEYAQRYQRPPGTTDRARGERARRGRRAQSRGRHRSRSRGPTQGPAIVRNYFDDYNPAERRAEPAPAVSVPTSYQVIVESDPDDDDEHEEYDENAANSKSGNKMVIEDDIPELNLGADVQFAPPSPFPEGMELSPRMVRKQKGQKDKARVQWADESDIEIEIDEPGQMSQQDNTEHRNSQKDVIPSTTFAGPYRSSLMRFLANQGPFERHKIDMLKHVNCSYLSTPGVAPSLEELKQHAQALAMLIRSVCFSTKGGVVDYDLGEGNGEKQKGKQKEKSNRSEGFHHLEAFDWLSDLGQPYTCERGSHKLPLTAVMNQLSPALSRPTQEEQEKHNQLICPLYPSPEAQLEKSQTRYPYATLENLVVHADTCLTRVDHELSATGGLMSLLPHEGPELDAANNTLLGQWIHFTRLLVARCHELEKSLNTSMETLANEAVVPRERLGDASIPDRVQTVEKDGWVHMQDKFILSGFTSALRKELHDSLQRRLDLSAVVDYDGNPRGLVWCHLRTKYVQLRGGKTIFIVPDWNDDGTVQSLEEEILKENRPTVVQVVKPEYRVPPSVFEARIEQDLKWLQSLVPENAMLKEKLSKLERDKEFAEMGLDIDVKKDKEWILKRIDDLTEMERKLGEERVFMKEEIKRELEVEFEKRNADLDEREGRISEGEKMTGMNTSEALRRQEATLRQEFEQRLQHEVAARMRGIAPEKPHGPTRHQERAPLGARQAFPQVLGTSRGSPSLQDHSPYVGPSEMLRPREDEDEDRYSEDEDIDY